MKRVLEILMIMVEATPLQPGQRVQTLGVYPAGPAPEEGNAPALTAARGLEEALLHAAKAGGTPPNHTFMRWAYYERSQTHDWCFVGHSETQQYVVRPVTVYSAGLTAPAAKAGNAVIDAARNFLRAQDEGDDQGAEVALGRLYERIAVLDGQ